MHSDKDCYGRCPKCGNEAWHRYKGKAHIYNDSGNGTHKVTLFKCSKCKKKFGFNIESHPKEG